MSSVVPGSASKARADPDSVALAATMHGHLVHRAIRRRRTELEVLADCPEAQQADAELALDALSSIPLQAFLDRVADVRRHVAEVRHAGLIATNPFAIIDDFQERFAPFAPPNDVNVLRPRIDAVLDELRHRFQRVVLRLRDDADRRPVVSNPKLAPRVFSSSHGQPRNKGVRKFPSIAARRPKVKS